MCLILDVGTWIELNSENWPIDIDLTFAGGTWFYIWLELKSKMKKKSTLILLLVAVLDVDGEEGGAEDDSTGGSDAQDGVHCWLDPGLLHLEMYL